MNRELEELGERIAEQAAHLDAAMHRMLADLREFDQRGGWHAQGAASCAHWLSWRVGWELVTARDHVRVARKLAETPVIDEALRRGEVSYSKVRALLRVATPANESLLLEYARLMTASQLEKLCRKYALVQCHGQDSHPQGDEQRRYVRRRDTGDGMVKIEAVLHPEEAEMVWTVLNHAATQLIREPAALPTHDSAESYDGAQPCGAVGTSPIPEAAAGRFDGSADVRRDSSQSTSTAIVPSRYGDEFEIDDSAESLAMAGAPLAPESLEAAPVPGTVDASSGDGEAPCRSLLDQLLHEAEAARAAESVAQAAGATTEIARSFEAGSSGEVGSSSGEPSSNQSGPRREMSVLRQGADSAKRAFNRADALVSLAQRYLRGDRPHRSPIEITLTIPKSSLSGEMADPVDGGEMGELFLSTEAARRLSCDAGVIEVVEDEHGAPLSVGRKRRTIAGALKRALHKRDGACTFPGCTNHIFLEGHHIRHWADGGETSLANTALLCSLHHRYVHEYGYAIEIGPDQRPRFRDRHGRQIAEVPARPAAADLGWPRIRAVNEPLAIDAGTIAGPWDGTLVDYGRIVGHLATAGHLRG